MKFTIYNKQNAVSIDEDFWKRAFNYAARELQIEHHHAMVECVFIPVNFERMVKFKTFSLGATDLTEQGAWFYVVTDVPISANVRAVQAIVADHQRSNEGRMVKTFFHEMAHVKQLLMRELINKPRSIVWKNEKWGRREYAFAPWEQEANTFADRSYDKFLRLEVNRVMQDENVHAYHPAVRQLCVMFSQDEVFRLIQELHKERERQALLSSGRDWLLVAPLPDQEVLDQYAECDPEQNV